MPHWSFLELRLSGIIHWVIIPDWARDTDAVFSLHLLQAESVQHAVNNRIITPRIL
jgi:hypothetical protein